MTKINLYLYGKVTNEGKIVLEDKEKWQRRLETLKDKKIQISLVERRKNRSLKQNGYLWGCVYKIIADETGHTPEEIHNIFKNLFLREETDLKGLNCYRTKHLSDLTTGGMVEYIMNIVAKAAELGITIPDADEWDPSHLRTQ